MNEAVQRLCLHEGIRLQPYKCPAGYWTIGVGLRVYRELQKIRFYKKKGHKK